MAPHLLRCQWIRVGYYTLNIGRLVEAKRKSRRRGSWGTLDFRSIRVLLVRILTVHRFSVFFQSFFDFNYIYKIIVDFGSIPLIGPNPVIPYVV